MPAPASTRRLERRQVEVPQPLLGHVGRVVVAAALGLTVGDEVLRAGDHLVRRAVVVALVALDARGRHHRAEVRVLAGTLSDPAPARLVRDVHHRGVRLLEPDRGRLAGADRGVVHRHLRVEAAGRAQRNREDRPEAMDRVEREQQRDVQPRLVNRDVLEAVDRRRIRDAQHRAEAVPHLLVGDQEVGEQLDLLQLLLQCHLREQGVDPAVDRRSRRLPAMAGRERATPASKLIASASTATAASRLCAVRCCRRWKRVMEDLL